MTRYIWKFPINADGVVKIQDNFEPLSVQVQNGAPVLWAIVNPDNYASPVKFQLFWTGDSVPDPELLGPYIDTFQRDGLVWHVFGPEPEKYD